MSNNENTKPTSVAIKLEVNDEQKVGNESALGNNAQDNDSVSETTKPNLNEGKISSVYAEELGNESELDRKEVDEDLLMNQPGTSGMKQPITVSVSPPVSTSMKPPRTPGTNHPLYIPSFIAKHPKPTSNVSKNILEEKNLTLANKKIELIDLQMEFLKQENEENFAFLRKKRALELKCFDLEVEIKKKKLNENNTKTE